MNSAFAKLRRRTRFCAFLILAFRILVTLPAYGEMLSALHPPFKKRWQSPAVEQVSSLARIGNTLCYGTFSSYGAVDLRTGRRLWQITLPDKYPSTEITSDGRHLYVEIGSKALLACSPSTGRVIWSLPLKGYASPMLSAGKTLFCELPDGVLRAVDTQNHRSLWMRNLEPEPLPKNDTRDLGLAVRPRMWGPRLFAATQEGCLLCLNAKNGRPLWQAFLGESEKGTVTGLIHDASRVYATTRGGVVIAWNTAGQRLWHFQASSGVPEEPVLLGSLICFVSNDGRLSAVEAATGKPRWTARLSTEADPTFSSLSVGKGQIIVASRSSLYAVGASGRRLWTWDSGRDFSAEPLMILQNGLLIKDDCFLRIVMGRPPELPSAPAARRAMAQRLTARFNSLDADQLRTLDKLGDSAFEALLPLVKYRLVAYERAAAQQKIGGRDSFPLYSKFSDAMDHLTAAAAPKHTVEIIALLAEAPTEDSRDPIFRCLAQKGDPGRSLSVFLRTLQQGRFDWGNRFNTTGVSLTAVTQSHDSRAVRFLIQALADPKADAEIRHAAYVNLARTGGVTGLNAVLAAREVSHQLSTLSNAVGLDALGTRTQPAKDFSAPLIATHPGINRELWGLIVSGAAGSRSDLWIARYDGAHWTDPLFTGSQLDKSGKYPASWFERFVGNPVLSRDSDGDGWTDLLEARIGTDPQRADTDGDGLVDSQDDNPLTAAPPSGDVSEVLAAAFEARFRFTNDAALPCLVEYPPGVKPFVLSGWDGIVVPSEPQTKTLSETIRYGTASVSFRLPQYDFAGAALARRQPDSGILWNGKHTAAKIQIVTYYGPLSATGCDISLQKFGTEWVVTRVEMVWES